MPRDFSRRRPWRGAARSGFGALLRFLNSIERLPAPIFTALLFFVGVISMRDWILGMGYWLFFLMDWLLLALLPRFEKSFGPPKPATLILAILRAPFAALPLPIILLAQTFGTLLVLYAFWIEPHRLGITRETLTTPKFRAPAPPLRVLHLGDLHIERITARERALIQRVKQLNPDLILFSGDFLNLSYVHDPLARAHAREILAQLSAPLGVFVVSGTYPVDQPEILEIILAGLPIRWLRDERVTLKHYGNAIELIGLACTHQPHLDRVALAAARNGSAGNLTILLYHAPDLAPEAALQNVDLQLSGHTHGGQVRLPFFGALFAGSLYGKKFEMGRYAIGALTLYVTRGIGMEGAGMPRARFLCPPEIVLWEIAGEAKIKNIGH